MNRSLIGGVFGAVALLAAAGAASAAAPEPTATIPDLLAKAKNEGKIVWYTSIELQTGGEDRQGLRGGVSRHRRAGRAQRLRAHRAAHRAGARQQYPRRRRRRMFRHDGAVRLEDSRAGSLPSCRPMSRNTRPTIAIRMGFTRPTGSRCRRSSTTRSSSSPRTRRKASPICSTRNGKARSSRRIPAIAARS